jgi:hypothetical protein
LNKTARRILLALVLVLVAAPATAQEQPPASGIPATINVFLDCGFCDFDYVRTEIPFVNWMRDRADADVHLLVTTQSTGGGGVEFAMHFIGLRRFSQTVDTLRYVASPNATADDQRRGYTRTIKTGLVPYLAKTTIGDRLQISVSAPATGGVQAAAAKADPWHGWVMSISANSYTSGEKSYNFLNGYFYGEAQRVTESWKSVIGSDFSYDDSKSTVELGNLAGDADTTYVTIKRNWSGYASQFRGFGQHWSAGISGTLGSNTYQNQQRYMRAKVGLEYNLFPYKESTRRQLRAQYAIGAAHYQYEDTTIYLKIEETVPIHFAAIAVSAKQPWGNLSGTVSHNALLRDPSKRSTRVSGNASIRIVKGLSFFFSGQYVWIHDQLYLLKGSASTTDVLLRQRALKTSYSYFGNIGLTYTFGSIFNNVVFPRFGGSNTF